MQLQSKDILKSLDSDLRTVRSQIQRIPGLALIWVGDDEETAKFVRAKQKIAKDLECDFYLHHFPKISQRQLLAVILGLNTKKGIDGIVLQLPLPKNIDTNEAINAIAASKDIDGLRMNSSVAAPTPSGIVALLEGNQIDLSQKKTVILGNGRLVGHPLAEIFTKNNWSFRQFDRNAQDHVREICDADVLIAATGQPHLVNPSMVHGDMIVVDGSGVDVDAEIIEPLVALITPSRGAIGPLTVRYLFKNLLTACVTG